MGLFDNSVPAGEEPKDNPVPEETPIEEDPQASAEGGESWDDDIVQPADEAAEEAPTADADVTTAEEAPTEAQPEAEATESEEEPEEEPPQPSASEETEYWRNEALRRQQADDQRILRERFEREGALIAEANRLRNDSEYSDQVVQEKGSGYVMGVIADARAIVSGREQAERDIQRQRQADFDAHQQVRQTAYRDALNHAKRNGMTEKEARKLFADRGNFASVADPKVACQLAKDAIDLHVLRRGVPPEAVKIVNAEKATRRKLATATPAAGSGPTGGEQGAKGYGEEWVDRMSAELNQASTPYHRMK